MIFLGCILSVKAQDVSTEIVDKCGTMQRLEAKFKLDPSFKTKFEANRASFNERVKAVINSNSQRVDNGQDIKTVYTIPIVFHIVLPDPTVVTDAQIMAQLDTLNEDYAGMNGDSTKIPPFFKPFFGKSSIRFCLSGRTPVGNPSTGIERIITKQSSFFDAADNDGVKHTSSGGADIWDGNKYFNVWICTLSNGIIGYSTFPNDNQPDEQGVVVDYRVLPGGSNTDFSGLYTNYRGGKTLTHETGHYFNLYHPWGLDASNLTCTGTDFVDDTPTQANPTYGSYTGVKTDACTPSGNGIMYENYMDYSNDDYLVMFTTLQVARIESALSLYRSSLLTSNSCQPLALRNYDAQLLSVSQPAQRVCTSAFTQVITLKNLGAQTLTSLTIHGKFDNGTVTTYNWTGSLSRLATASVTLPSVSTATGQHTFTLYISNPNNATDEDHTNDTLSVKYQYYEPVANVSESFEGSVIFPPSGWDIVNPDNLITWSRAAGVAKTGNASAMMDNFSVQLNGRKDDLRLPNISLPPTLDSAFFSFQVAAAVKDTNNVPDTLEVLVSSDCGQTYSSIYKKYGSTLITRTASTTTAFVPSAAEWRKDSINLAAYIGAGNIVIAFRNTGENQNNIYLDDVNLRTVIVNPNLKAQGFLVTPNPVVSSVAVQFYPQPSNLRVIQLYNITGQKLFELNTSGVANNYYSFDMSRFAAGTFVVRAVFTDKVMVKKIVKF